MRHLQQNKWGDHLRQGRPSMAAINGLARPSMAIKSAMDGPARPVVAGDHLRRDSTLLNGLIVQLVGNFCFWDLLVEKSLI